MPPNSVPRQFTGKESSASGAILHDKNYSAENIINPSIIHYYCKEKPWQFLLKYEVAGCPDHSNFSNSFWGEYWKHNAWSFWIWYQYYKEYCEVEALAEVN
jgi:lipopolysaccharide biosynthesis glycosyltransferase